MFGAELAAPEPRSADTLPSVEELFESEVNGGDEGAPGSIATADELIARLSRRVDVLAKTAGSNAGRTSRPVPDERAPVRS